MSKDAPKLTSQNEDSVSLTWEASPSGGVTYVVERQSGAGWEPVTECKDNSATLSACPSKESSFRVFAKNDFGTSDPTKAVKVKKCGAAPATVQKLAVQAIESDAAKLSWKPPVIPDGHIDIPVKYEISKR